MKATASAIGKFEDPRLEAAQKRVRESVSRTDTLEALREIVTNLLGCEEIALFTVEHGKSGLCWSFGIDPQRYATLEGFRESGLQRVLAGECHVARTGRHDPGDDAPPRLRVFVPIRSSNRTVAVLVMLRLLPQKLDFDEADEKLAKVLSDEIARALFDASTTADTTHA
jgi:GAF domain-containing protein